MNGNSNSKKRQTKMLVKNSDSHRARRRFFSSEIVLSNRSFPIDFPHRNSYGVFAKDTELRIYVRKMPSAKLDF